MKIEKMLIKHNFSKRQDTIKYIVIHDTGNTGKGAGVKSHFNYFNGGNRGASADYFVDDKIIGQFINDYNYSWHCGDGRGKYGITNSNSIGIEMCINSDGNYDKTIENTIELVKYLMDKYNINIDKVVRHYDASRKSCPNSMKSNNWAKWIEFKNKLVNNNNSFIVKIDKDIIDIKENPNNTSNTVGNIKDKGKYTIIETEDNWGKLKSGAGWIDLDNIKENNIKVNSKVKVIGSKYATGQTIPNWVKNNTYIIKSINEDKALLSEINSWIYLKDLQII